MSLVQREQGNDLLLMGEKGGCHRNHPPDSCFGLGERFASLSKSFFLSTRVQGLFKTNSVILLAFSSDASRCKWNEPKQLSKETQKVNDCCFVVFNFDERQTSEQNTRALAGLGGHATQGEHRKLIIGAPPEFRVMRVFRLLSYFSLKLYTTRSLYVMFFMS